LRSDTKDLLGNQSVFNTPVYEGGSPKTFSIGGTDSPIKVRKNTVRPLVVMEDRILESKDENNE